MEEKNIVDRTLEALNFTEKEKDYFKNNLEIISQSQTDPSINVETEIIKNIQECVKDEI